MITKSIYSYRVRIKYGVYTRTIIGGVFPPISLQPTICSLSVLSALCSLSKPTGSGVVLGAVDTLFGVSLWYKQSRKRRQQLKINSNPFILQADRKIIGNSTFGRVNYRPATNSRQIN